MLETRNSAKEIELRRRQNTLIIVGAGTILFGVWSIVKTLGLFYFDKARRMTALKTMIEANGAEWKDSYYTLAIILAVIILTWDLIFRTFIGWAAISAGHGKNRSILYIIIACLMLWSSVWTITGLSADYVNYLTQITAEIPETQMKEPSLSLHNPVSCSSARILRSGGNTEKQGEKKRRGLRGSFTRHACA